MIKQDIITLVNCGILSMTAHDLGTKEAYKAFRLKKEVERVFKEIQDEQKAIREENGLTEEVVNNIQKIMDKVNIKANATEDERQQLLAYNEQNRVVTGLLKEANQCEVKLDIKTVSYEDWRTLQAENRAKDINGRTFDILGGEAEIVLEGIFWEEPKE